MPYQWMLHQSPSRRLSDGSIPNFSGPQASCYLRILPLRADFGRSGPQLAPVAAENNHIRRVLTRCMSKRRPGTMPRSRAYGHNYGRAQEDHEDDGRNGI